MKTIGKRFIISCPETHEKNVNGIILLEKFDNAQKTKQISEIVSVPEGMQDIAEVGDKLLHHFNITTFTLKDGKKIDSNYKIDEQHYFVPLDMSHAVIKKDGTVIMLNEWNIVTPIKKKEEVSASGIVISLNNDELKNSAMIMRGSMVHINDELSDELVPNDEVMLSKYSDYSFKNEEGETKWLVENRQILCRYED